MSRHEFARLTEFCLQTPSRRGEYICSEYNTLWLDLKLCEYRHGLCKKLSPSASHITVVYLAEKTEDFELLDTLTDRSFPKEFFNIFKCRTLRAQSPFYNAVLTLFDPCDEFDVEEAKTFLRAIAEKLCKSGMRISSEISFNETDITHRDHRIGLHPGPYAMIFTSLLSVLDIASESCNINVAFHSEGDTFEVDMYTESRVTEHIWGNISDIVSLSHYIRGSCMYLAVAAAAATEAGMYISANCTHGRLRFIFGALTDPFPILEFKYRDPSERVVFIHDAVLTVLNSHEFNARAEELQAEG